MHNFNLWQGFYVNRVITSKLINMDYLAGFYIVSGFLIIFFRNEFIRKTISDSYNTGHKHIKRIRKIKLQLPIPSFNKLTLQEIPVRSTYNNNY